MLKKTPPPPLSPLTGSATSSDQSDGVTEETSFTQKAGAQTAMSTAATFFSDPVICYFLDTFLLLYCLIATALFFREKFLDLQAAEPCDETKDIYQELNQGRDADTYEVLKTSSDKKNRGKKKKTRQTKPQPRDKDLYESLVPKASPAPPAVR